MVRVDTCVPRILETGRAKAVDSPMLARTDTCDAHQRCLLAELIPALHASLSPAARRTHQSSRAHGTVHPFRKGSPTSGCVSHRGPDASRLFRSLGWPNAWRLGQAFAKGGVFHERISRSCSDRNRTRSFGNHVRTLSAFDGYSTQHGRSRRPGITASDLA